MYPMILKYWFEEIDRSHWWSKNDAFDQRIRERFAGIHAKQFAVSFLIGERTQKGDWLKLLFWISSQEICLEIHLCLSRMIHWLGAISRSNFSWGKSKVKPNQRSFLYMPFMHSESLIIMRWRWIYTKRMDPI